MALTLRGVSLPVFGTTSATASAVSGTAPGDASLLLAANKRGALDTPATPTGWEQVFTCVVNPTGTVTGNQGPVRLTALARTVPAGGLTIPALTIPSSSSAVIGVSNAVFTPDAGEVVQFGGTFGLDSPGSTAWSVTGEALAGGITAGDIIAALTGQPDNGVTVASGLLSSGGAAFGTTTERFDTSTGNGDDMAMAGHTAPVSTGTSSSGAPTFTATMSGYVANQQGVGGTMFIRARAVAAGAPVRNRDFFHVLA